MVGQKKLWVSLAFFLASLAFYLPSLGSPPRLYWDETIHVNGARNLLSLPGPHKDQMHPPLGREILTASLYLFGDTPAGARVLSAFAGAFSIALVFLIATQLTSKALPSLLPPILLWLDPLYFVHARIGMLDLFVTFFMLLSFWMFLRIFETPPAQRKAFSYYLLGIFLGLGFAVKTLTAILYPLFFVILCAGILKPQRPGPSQGSVSPQAFSPRHHLLHLTLAFTVPTIFIFWLPYALIGFSLSDIQEHLTWYWNFMRTFKGHPAALSRWYEWLVVRQPIWYLNYPVDSLKSLTVVCTGNYLFWISSELVFIVTLFFWKRLPKITFTLHAIIAAQFAFWAIKPTTHLYYMLTIIPFYALLMGVFFNFLLENFSAKKKYILFDTAIYLACCLFIFSYYFPLIRGTPIEKARVTQFLFPGTDAPGADPKSSQMEPPSTLNFQTRPDFSFGSGAGGPL